MWILIGNGDKNYINDQGHMVKMTAIPFVLQNQKCDDFETWHGASGIKGLQNTIDINDDWRFLRKCQRTTCIKQGFWPTLKQKIESYFRQLSLDCFNI